MINHNLSKSYLPFNILPTLWGPGMTIIIATIPNASSSQDSHWLVMGRGMLDDFTDLDGVSQQPHCHSILGNLFCVDSGAVTWRLKEANHQCPVVYEGWVHCLNSCCERSYLAWFVWEHNYKQHYPPHISNSSLMT